MNLFKVFFVYICVHIRRFSLRNVFEIDDLSQRLCTFSNLLDTDSFVLQEIVTSFPRRCVNVVYVAVGSNGSFIFMLYRIPLFKYTTKDISILPLIKCLIYFQFCFYYK